MYLFNSFFFHWPDVSHERIEVWILVCAPGDFSVLSLILILTLSLSFSLSHLEWTNKKWDLIHVYLSQPIFPFKFFSVNDLNVFIRRNFICTFFDLKIFQLRKSLKILEKLIDWSSLSLSSVSFHLLYSVHFFLSILIKLQIMSVRRIFEQYHDISQTILTFN